MFLLEAFRLKWLLQFANFGMPVTMMLLSYYSVPLCILYDTANAVGPIECRDLKRVVRFTKSPRTLYKLCGR